MKFFTVRSKDGDTRKVRESKVLEAEKDGFLPVVSNGEREARTSTRNLAKAAQDGFKPVVESDLDAGTSAYRGAFDGLGFDFKDELSGIVEAAGRKVGLSNLGGRNLLDVRLETDEEDGKPFWDVYRERRDQTRAESAEAELANPNTYGASKIAGGVAGSVVPGTLGANVLKQGIKGATKLAAAEGAAFGLGSSKADLTTGDPKEFARAGIDTAMGGATGAAGGYVGGQAIKQGGKAIGKAGEYAKGLKNYVGEKIPTLKRGFKSVKTEDTVLGENVLGNIERLGRGVVSSVKELGETSTVKKEYGDIAQQARRVIIKPLREAIEAGEANVEAFGNGKQIIDDLSDDDAILLALMEDGNNPVKEWVAETATTVFPGRLQKDQYLEILNIPRADRLAARSFDKREAAKQIKPTFDKVKELFEGARSKRWEELQDAAAKQYDPVATPKVLQSFNEAIDESELFESIPSGVRSFLRDTKRIISDGLAPGDKELKRNLKNFDVDGVENFKRLQKARQALDSKIKWAADKNYNEAEKLLITVRDDVDSVLKGFNSKIEADDLYKASKELESKFFNAVEFKKNGLIDIDESKIKGILGNTDQAYRFRDAIEDLKEFAGRPDLEPTFKAQASDLVNQLENAIKVVENKTKIGGFNYTQGPTSSAVERIGSISKGNTMLEDAIQSPSGFVNQMDQWTPAIEKRLGKPLSQMSQQEKQGIIKVWVWKKDNPSASAQRLESQMEKFIPGYATKKARDEFINK